MRKVDYFVYEGTIARLERTIKRAWIVAVTALIALVLTNILWASQGRTADAPDPPQQTEYME